MTGASTKTEAIRRAEQSMRDKQKAKSSKKKLIKQPKGSSMNVGSLVRAPVTQFEERFTHFETSKSSKRGADMMVRGQDFVGALPRTDAINVATGQALLNYLVNPTSGAFEGTRLQKFAQLYEKYCFTKLRFHVQTSFGTSQSGSYILAYDRDMADTTPPQGEEGVKQYLAMQGTRMSAYWQNLSIDCPLIDTQDFYYTNYTGVDGRITTQGQLYVANVSQTYFSAGNNGTLNVWVEYECHFMIPQLENSLKVYKGARNTPNIKKPLYDDPVPTGSTTRPVLVDLLKLLFRQTNQISGTTPTNVRPRRLINSLPDTVPGVRSTLSEIVENEMHLPRGFFEFILTWAQDLPTPPSGSATTPIRMNAYTNKQIGNPNGHLPPVWKVDQSMYPGPGQGGSVGIYPLLTTYEDTSTSGITLDEDLVSSSSSVSTVKNFARFLVNVRDLFSPIALILYGNGVTGQKGLSEVSFSNFNLYINEVDQATFDLA